MSTASHPHELVTLVTRRWVHGRTHDGGHQLHFDANESLFHAGADGYRLQHPAASSILFLDDGCGGPTLITDQVGPTRHGG